MNDKPLKIKVLPNKVPEETLIEVDGKTYIVHPTDTGHKLIPVNKYSYNGVSYNSREEAKAAQSARIVKLSQLNMAVKELQKSFTAPFYADALNAIGAYLIHKLDEKIETTT